MNKPITPSQALELFLESHATDYRESTLKSKRSRIGMFVDFCDENGIDRLEDIDGMTINQYRIDQADGLARRTLASRLSDLRTFLRWAESINAVESGLSETVLVPDVENPRSRLLEPHRADRILDYLKQYEYATKDHVTVHLFWETGMRLGSLRGLDLDDYNPDESYLQLRHRPDTDTPLKNGRDGERPVAITAETAYLIDDYLENNRHAVTDDHGRDPLITTKRGRPGIATYRRTVYRYTRPCTIGLECPHDRQPEQCEATETTDQASRCPSTVSPHDLRRGSITHLLRNDVPKPVIADRCDTSPDVLDKHYDKRSSVEKMEQRRGYLENL